eukprot:COSAG01_NODE_44228_length_421_cov_0.950311_1_plen_38_part_01
MNDDAQLWKSRTSCPNSVQPRNENPPSSSTKMTRKPHS